MKEIPSLFAREGKVHDLLVGRIINIRDRGRRIFIEYLFDESYAPIPYSAIEPWLAHLDIQPQELNRTHWGIKDEDLYSILDRMKVLRRSALPPGEKFETGVASMHGDNKLPRLEVTYIKKLGSGAFGTVWQASDALLERDVAVKFLTSTADSMDEASLIREARSLAKISHPNLVTVYAAAWLRHPETKLLAPAILMELLRGETLADWSSSSHSRDEVLRVALGLVSGVLAMHSAELVHADLHSGNVMVLPDATVKLIDWRYQDTFLLRSSSYRRDEVESEQRRAIDRVVSLLEGQSLSNDSARFRNKSSLLEVQEILGQLLSSSHLTQTE